MIQELKQNVQTELAIAREMVRFCAHKSQASPDELALVKEAISSLAARTKLINNSLVGLTRAISLAKPLTSNDRVLPLEKVTVASVKDSVILRRGDKNKYLEELSISEQLLKKLKNHNIIKKEEQSFYRTTNSYARLANRFFLPLSDRLLSEGNFKSLNTDLRKGNINVLTPTYVSMMFLTTLLSLAFGVVLFLFFMFFSISLAPPAIVLYEGGIISRLGILFGLLIAPALVTFSALYIYPSSEAKSIARKIDSELPFVVIHMGSIAGSGIEPTQIFKIVGLSKEYPATRSEIRKLLNQLNIYGYDLITALRNVARMTSSQRLSELLNGLSTTVNSGGDLKTFFEKRAETLLLNYRLEREKFTKVAETFMDIYISVVIATPMILLLLLIMISVAQVNVGLDISVLTFLIIGAVALVNVVFLWLLSMKQPTY